MKTAGEAAIKPLYYFYGDEDYLMQEALERIREKALTGGFESMNHHVFEGKTLDAAEVINAARTMPAFSPMRLVVIKGAESLSAVRKKELHEYAKAPSPSTCLVFISGNAKPDRAGELFKYLDSKGCVRAFKRLETPEVRLWIRQYAKGCGKDITEAATELLVVFTDNRLMGVKAELDKLVLYVGSKKTIDEHDVEACALDLRDESAFDLADAIAGKDRAGAFRILARIEGEPPVKVLGAMAWQMRTLIKVKSYLSEGVQPYRLSGMLRISRKNMERYVRSAGNSSGRELLSALAALGRADTDIKSGRLPGHLALSRLVMDLTAEARQAAAASRRTGQ